MSTTVLRDAKIYINQYDLSSRFNDISVTDEAAMVPNTTFGQTYDVVQPGLKKAVISGKGYVEDGVGLIGTVASGLVGLNSDLMVCGENSAVSGGNAGDVAWFIKGLHSNYQAGGQVGAMHAFSFNCATPASSTAPLTRGRIFEDGKTSRTTAGNSGVITLGAVAAGQSVFAQIHVLAFSGTDVTFKLRSAVTSFATITDRIAFAQVTGLTSETPAPVAGAITDTFWRVDWTTVGGFTSFSAVVVAGIK